MGYEKDFGEEIRKVVMGSRELPFYGVASPSHIFFFCLESKWATTKVSVSEGPLHLSYDHLNNIFVATDRNSVAEVSMQSEINLAADKMETPKFALDFSRSQGGLLTVWAEGPGSPRKSSLLPSSSIFLTRAGKSQSWRKVRSRA